MWVWEGARLDILHNSQVEPSQRDDRDEERREAGTDDNQDEQAHCQSATETLDNTSENLICNISVAREEVENASRYFVSEKKKLEATFCVLTDQLV